MRSLHEISGVRMLIWYLHAHLTSVELSFSVWHIYGGSIVYHLFKYSYLSYVCGVLRRGTKRRKRYNLQDYRVADLTSRIHWSGCFSLSLTLLCQGGL